MKTLSRSYGENFQAMMATYKCGVTYLTLGMKIEDDKEGGNEKEQDETRV